MACAWLLAFAAAGCGEDVSEDPDTLALPSTDTGAGWRFGDDTGTSNDSANPDDGHGTDDGAVASDVEDTGGGTDADDVADDTTMPDVATGPITTCSGVCGLFLEDNPCHCDHGCLGGSPGCCGGDGAYLATCACNTDSDCNDNNPCTTDSCQTKGANKLCMNLPVAKCCKSNADCSGGDGVCTLATCLDGACSVLAKDCGDGVECTIDTCDPGSGDCQHVLPASACQIDGACWKAGDAKPGTGGCQRCKPDVDAKAWTAEANKCFIDGECVAAGAKASAGLDECRVCIPSTDSANWSVVSGTCWIGGTCYNSGAASAGATCQVCSPSSSQTQWSGKPGTCAVDGACYDAGAASPGGSCATCNPSVTTAAFTVTAGSCLIDGACVAKGAAKPGSGGCAICDPDKSKSEWTQQLAKPCDDGDPCTSNDVCTSTAGCQGKPKGAACCKSDTDCLTQVQPATCEKAQCKGDGTCAVVKDPLCCQDGKCCDLTLKQVMAKGTLCEKDDKKKEYKCEGNAGYYRLYGSGCPGDSPFCSSATEGFGPWIAMSNVVCGGGTVCSSSSIYTSPVCK